MQNIQQLLQSMGAQQVGIGGMQGMAVDGMQFLKLLQQLQVQVGELAAENAELRAALDQQGYTPAVQLPQTPQFPEDFNQYGGSAFSQSISNEVIQSMIDEVEQVELADVEFIEQSLGDTVVIKMRGEDGVERIVVAKGYFDYILNPEDEDRCDCGNCL